MKSWPQWNQWEFCHWLQWGQDFSLDAHDIFFLTFRMMKQPWFWLAQGINSITQLEQNSNQTSGIFADAALFCRAVCSWRDPKVHLKSRTSFEPLSLDLHLSVPQYTGSKGLVSMEASCHMSCDIHFSSVNSSLKEPLMSHSLLPNWALTLNII